jgi:hypothetical protein
VERQKKFTSDLNIDSCASVKRPLGLKAETNCADYGTTTQDVARSTTPARENRAHCHPSLPTPGKPGALALGTPAALAPS